MSQQYRIPVYKVSLVRDASAVSPMRQIRSSLDAIDLFRGILDGVDREHFLVAMVDTKHTIIGVNIVSTGSLSSSVVHPREVFKPAILTNAAAIICCHNHPSGNPAPSAEDRAITTRLVDGGKLLGIAVLDHMILGDGTTDFFSFADNGLIA